MQRQWIGQTARLLVAAAAAAGLLAGTAMAAGGGGGGGGLGGGFGSGTSAQSEPKAPTETRTYKKAVKLINEGEYAEAIERLNKVLADAPEDPDVLNYLGFAHRKLGKTDEAMGYYTKALAAAPDHLGANEYLGELYLQINDLPKAEEQQAKLELLCAFGCSELEDLKKAIADYKAKNPAGPAS